MQYSQPCHVLIDPLCPPSLTHSAHPPLPRSQQTTPPTPSPQGNKPRIIYSSPFPLVPSVFICFSLCSNLSLSPLSVFVSPSQLFFNRCRYRARVEKVESPAKVHVFYLDYGNVSTFATIDLTVQFNF